MNKANMFKYIVFICLNIFCMSSLADEVTADFGLGVFHSADSGRSETKFFSFGLQEDLWTVLKERVTVGGFIDNSGNGKNSSGLLMGQLGVEVDNRGVVASMFTGIGAITAPDILLGGYMQFMSNLGLGIHDRDGNYFGVRYTHISSAGFEMPNEGRDLLGIELKFPF